MIQQHGFQLVQLFLILLAELAAQLLFQVQDQAPQVGFPHIGGDLRVQAGLRLVEQHTAHHFHGAQRLGAEHLALLALDFLQGHRQILQARDQLGVGLCAGDAVLFHHAGRADVVAADEPHARIFVHAFKQLGHDLPQFLGLAGRQLPGQVHRPVLGCAPSTVVGGVLGFEINFPVHFVKVPDLPIVLQRFHGSSLLCIAIQKPFPPKREKTAFFVTPGGRNPGALAAAPPLPFRGETKMLHGLTAIKCHPFTRAACV